MAVLRPEVAVATYHGKPLRVIFGENDVWFPVSDICDMAEFADPKYAMKSVDSADRVEFVGGKHSIGFPTQADFSPTLDVEDLFTKRRNRILRKSATVALLKASKKASAKAFLSWLDKSGVLLIGPHGKLSLDEEEKAWWDKRNALQDRCRELARIAQAKPGGWYDFMRPDSYKNPKIWREHDEALAELNAHVATKPPKTRRLKAQYDAEEAAGRRQMYNEFEVEWARKEKRQPRVMTPEQAIKLTKVEDELREASDKLADELDLHGDELKEHERLCEVKVRKAVEAALDGLL